jgi:hypothetical protein
VVTGGQQHHPLALAVLGQLVGGPVEQGRTAGQQGGGAGLGHPIELLEAGAGKRVLQLWVLLEHRQQRIGRQQPDLRELGGSQRRGTATAKKGHNPGGTARA